MKQELHTIVSSSKKRRASDSDEDIIHLDAPSSSVIRPPVKKLPTSKPDFHSFAPKNRKLLYNYLGLIVLQYSIY